jgi:hypothetical protein
MEDKVEITGKETGEKQVNNKGRFPKGQSGNLKGRPPKKEDPIISSIKKFLAAEANIPNKTNADVAVREIADRAVEKGDYKTLLRLLELGYKDEK